MIRESLLIEKAQNGAKSTKITDRQLALCGALSDPLGDTHLFLFDITIVIIGLQFV